MVEGDRNFALEQPASIWTRISCSSTLESINFSAFNRFGAYFWDGGVTQIFLKYNESAKPFLLTIASTSIASQEVKELFDKDKD